jgi:hypothetical protein
MMPRFSSVFVAAVLVAIAVPFSPAFFAIADLAFGGIGANELLTLVPLSLSWLLWTWAGINLLTGIVFGIRGTTCSIATSAPRALVAHGVGMGVLALFGLFLVEAVL